MDNFDEQDINMTLTTISHYLDISRTNPNAQPEKQADHHQQFFTWPVTAPIEFNPLSEMKSIA